MNAQIKHGWDNAISLLKPTPAELERGLELHRQSVVVDAFGFHPLSVPADLASCVKQVYEAGASRHELERLIQRLLVMGAVRDEAAQAQAAAAMDAAGVTCIVQHVGEGRNIFESFERLSWFVHLCDHLPHLLTKAVAADDVVRAKQENRRCLLFSLNGPVMDQHWDFWDDELKWIRTFYYAGVRYMHLTYNRRNRCGDGCVEPANAGLSDYGADVIREMNRLGVVVDVAHCGERTSIDAAAVSGKPIVASHTGALAVHHHVRNKSDDAVHAICDGGGYVGVYAAPPFLGGGRDILAMMNHIDYLTDRFGCEHVAIGTDAPYLPPMPETVSRTLANLKPKRSFWSHWPANDPLLQPGAEEECRTGSLMWTNWPLLTVALIQRGYTDEQIRAILGGNCLRVLDAHGH